MRILVWTEPIKLRGVQRPQVLGKAMAADGTMLAQRTFQAVDWAKKALCVDEQEAYRDAYPLGYELVWLDHPELEPDWWEAVFFDDRPYKIRLVDHGSPKLWYFEFRDRKSAAPLGYVVFVAPLKTFFVSPGHTSPRYGDIFPEPGFTKLADAMRAAHDAFKEIPRAS